MKVSHYQAWVVVDHPAASPLEFILTRAAERNGKEPDFYWDALFRAVELEFTTDKTCGMIETSVYGDIMMNIESETLIELDKTLKRCQTVINRWKAKYHINRMV